LESITALNNGLEAFKGAIIFASHDHQLLQTIAPRIINLSKDQFYNKEISYDEYLKAVMNVAE
ncbi:ABC transporter ATP-binding protein, partial [Listeria monocytogenes]|nr:ABC transporter ATP-binding protein [Listeria monocytogenes]